MIGLCVGIAVLILVIGGIVLVFLRRQNLHSYERVPTYNAALEMDNLNLHSRVSSAARLEEGSNVIPPDPRNRNEAARVDAMLRDAQYSVAEEAPEDKARQQCKAGARHMEDQRCARVSAGGAAASPEADAAVQANLTALPEQEALASKAERQREKQRQEEKERKGEAEQHADRERVEQQSKEKDERRVAVAAEAEALRKTTPPGQNENATAEKEEKANTRPPEEPFLADFSEYFLDKCSRRVGFRWTANAVAEKHEFHKLPPLKCAAIFIGTCQSYRDLTNATRQLAGNFHLVWRIIMIPSILARIGSYLKAFLLRSSDTRRTTSWTNARPVWSWLYV